MSPATSVLEYHGAAGFGVRRGGGRSRMSARNSCCQYGNRFSHAGGRAMVSTAGGGFALMEEGLSWWASWSCRWSFMWGNGRDRQRACRRRTQQGDLNLTLYAGHGDFPRAIFAPATFDDGIRLTCSAFNLADKYQIPVFVLTDQYFLDSSRTMDAVDISTCIKGNYYAPPSGI